MARRAVTVAGSLSSWHRFLALRCADSGQLRASVQRVLKLLAVVVLRDSLPRNPNGKILKRKPRAQYVRA